MAFTRCAAAIESFGQAVLAATLVVSRMRSPVLATAAACTVMIGHLTHWSGSVILCKIMLSVNSSGSSDALQNHAVCEFASTSLGMPTPPSLSATIGLQQSVLIAVVSLQM